jgi:hypothetical protein
MDVFVTQALLTSVDVLPDSSCRGSSTDSDDDQQNCQGGWLSLVMVEPEQQLKARVLLSLSGVLAAAQPSGEPAWPLAATCKITMLDWAMSGIVQ